MIFVCHVSVCIGMGVWVLVQVGGEIRILLQSWNYWWSSATREGRWEPNSVSLQEQQAFLPQFQTLYHCASPNVCLLGTMHSFCVM